MRLLDDPKQYIQDIRADALYRVIRGLAVVGAIGAPLSASRAFVTGWMAIYSLHFAIGFVAIGLWAFSRFIPLKARFWLLMGLMWAVGILGLVNYGMLGAGTWWLALSALLGGMVMSFRTGVWLAGAAISAVSLVAWAFGTGVLTLAIDANAYMASFSTWATYLIAAGWLPLVIFTSFFRLSSAIVKLAEETAEAQADLRKMANTDSLTGALRPHVLKDRLEYALVQSKRSHDLVGVIFIDLDEFKPINDTYGHAIGDAVLIEVVRRARATLRAEDIISRLGGDEFVVVISGVKAEEEILAVAQKLKDAISRPFYFQGARLNISLSVGVTFGSAETQNVKQLLDAADQLMYEAKRSGRNTICLGRSELTSAA